MNSRLLAVHICVVAVVLCGCDDTRIDPADRAQHALETTQDRVLIHAVDAPVDQVSRLEGRVGEAMPNTDAPRVLYLEAGVPAVGLSTNEALLDARIVSGGVLVLAANNELRLHTKRGVRTIDDMVHGPLSVANGKVAYMKGGVPDMTLHLADLGGGPPESLTPEVRGWSPALSANGDEVIFVGNVDGAPQVLHHDGDALYEVAWNGRFPTAPVAPRWLGRHFVFEDEEGVAVLDLETSELVVEYAGASLLPDESQGKAWVMVNGERKAIELTEVAQ